jgi:hypothetical protein
VSNLWKLMNSDPPQIMIIDQSDTELRVFQFTEDRLGMVKGPIDGQPHSQTVDGAACDFLAQWVGDALFFETQYARFEEPRGAYPAFDAPRGGRQDDAGKARRCVAAAGNVSREMGEASLTVPEITLSVFGGDATLRPAFVRLEKPPHYSERYGKIGMDLLNSAQQMTLDFQAMRLTVE